MPFFCRKIVRVITGLGVLPLCIDEDSLTINSGGLVLSNPGFSFVSIKKSSKCDHIKVSLFLYPFDLCLSPLNKPVEVTYKIGNEYKTLTLLP